MSATHLAPLQKTPEASRSLHTLWNRLIEPAPSITDTAERRQVRLLSTVLLVFMVLGLVVLLLVPFLNGTGTVSIVPLVTTIMVFIPYLLSRTKHYKIAASMLLLLVITGVMYPGLTSTSATRVISFFFLVLPILLASMLLPKRAVIMLMIAVTVGLAALPVITGQVIPSLSSPVILMIISSALLMVFLNHRDGMERDRQAELKEALKQAEIANEAIAKANSELGTKNQELARANALAKESARLKSEFLATMSHELRTPLNAIRGFTSIMLEGMGGEIDDEAQHMVTRIHSNGDRLLNLINDILDIAKIEAGRMELVQEALLPRQLVEQWQTQMSILAEQKGISFEVNVDPNLPETVYGDGQRITQIATNLLSNAFKFTKEGKVTLDVEQAADTWLIRVSDTGVGIPPHALNYIFEEFRQVDSSSKREYGGTGLGLAIVRNLCRTMGGSVRVTSELGAGSVFTVVLPLNIETQPQLALVS